MHGVWSSLHCSVSQPTLTLDNKVVNLYQYETGSNVLFTTSCAVNNPAANTCQVSISNVHPSNPCGNCFAVYPCNANGGFAASAISTFSPVVSLSSNALRIRVYGVN